MSLRKWAARGTEKVEASFGGASCRRDGCGRYVRSSLPLAPCRAAAPANRTRHPAETQPTRSPQRPKVTTGRVGLGRWPLEERPRWYGQLCGDRTST
jgi:hypothetical protein